MGWNLKYKICLLHKLRKTTFSYSRPPIYPKVYMLKTVYHRHYLLLSFEHLLSILGLKFHRLCMNFY